MNGLIGWELFCCDFITNSCHERQVQPTSCQMSTLYEFNDLPWRKYDRENRIGSFLSNTENMQIHRSSIDWLSSKLELGHRAV